MPELPEVETVRRSLEDRVVGRRIDRVEVLAPKFIRHPDVETFLQTVVGKTVTSFGRCGKYLILPLSDGHRMIIHLKMAGRLLYCGSGEPLVKHTHVIFILDNGDHLRYIDLRHFGGIHLVSPEGKGSPTGLLSLGQEPLSSDFTVQYLSQALAKRKTRIKALLLDQAVIAGLGNIYADECLFQAGIHPERQAYSLSAEEVARLHQAIVEIIARAIENRGTTFSTYVDGDGRRGNYAEMLQVYQRDGEPCPRCGRPLHRVKVGGRSSHFCPQCQPIF